MKKLGCVILLVLLLAILAVLGGAAYFGYKTVDETVGWDVAKKAVSGGANTIKGLARGELRLRLPDELWQGEVRRVFPITESFTDSVTVEISNPQFLVDADPAWLRVSLDLVANVGGGENMRVPGKLEVRTQLRYDKANLRVLLHNPELAEFQFTGEMASLAESLKPVLAEVIAAELTEFEVVSLSDEKVIEQIKGGVEYLKDVVVEDNGVVVVIGK